MSEHARPFDVRTYPETEPWSNVEVACPCGGILRIEAANRLYPSSIEVPVADFLRRHRRHKPTPRRSRTLQEQVLDSFNQPMWSSRHETRTETPETQKGSSVREES